MDSPISCHALQNIRSAQYTPSLRYLQAEENELAETAVELWGVYCMRVILLNRFSNGSIYSSWMTL